MHSKTSNPSLESLEEWSPNPLSTLLFEEATSTRYLMGKAKLIRRGMLRSNCFI